MNIVFFVHCFFPDHFYGTETYTLALAKYYQAEGHRVTVVSAVFQGEATRTELVTRYAYEGVPVVCIDKNCLPHTRVKETYYQSTMAGVLRQVLTELSPDIVHVTHLINHTATLLEVTKSMGIATYATFTDFFGFCLNNKLEAVDGTLCLGPSSSRTNCVACHLQAAAPSQAPGSWLSFAGMPWAAKSIAAGLHFARHFPPLRKGPMDGLLEDIVRRPETLSTLFNAGYRSAVAPTQFLGKAYKANGIQVPLHSIHFGVDIDRSAKPGRKTGRTPVIGFIGQIAPHKGTDILIDAFKRLPRGAASLQIYGPMNQDADYAKRLTLAADGHPIEFKGTFDSAHMAEVLRGMDLLVIPSRWYENSPLVLLNALATHTPVLVTDVAGMTEFVQPDVNGNAFELGSVDALHAQLVRLTATPETLHAMALTTHYDRTPHTMALETLAMY